MILMSHTDKIIKNPNQIFYRKLSTMNIVLRTPPGSAARVGAALEGPPLQTIPLDPSLARSEHFLEETFEFTQMPHFETLSILL